MKIIRELPAAIPNIKSVPIEIPTTSGNLPLHIINVQPTASETIVYRVEAILNEESILDPALHFFKFVRALDMETKPICWSRWRLLLSCGSRFANVTVYHAIVLSTSKKILGSLDSQAMSSQATSHIRPVVDQKNYWLPNYLMNRT